MAGQKTTNPITVPASGNTAWVLRGPHRLFNLNCTVAGDGSATAALYDAVDQRGYVPTLDRIGEPFSTVAVAATGTTPINRMLNAGLVVVLSWATTAPTVTCDFA